MNLIKIENKIFKVPKKVYETLLELRKDEKANINVSTLPEVTIYEYCESISKGEVYGVRYLGVVEFDNKG
jgi:hypothetical protein